MADTYKTALDKAYKRVKRDKEQMFILKDDKGYYASDELSRCCDSRMSKAEIIEIIKYWGE